MNVLQSHKNNVNSVTGNDSKSWTFTFIQPGLSMQFDFLNQKPKEITTIWILNSVINTLF